MEKIKIKRIYDERAEDDGYRVLVDRLWPRGVSKQDANLDEWKTEIAPSSELRKWFNHEKNRFDKFTELYRDELEGRAKELEELREIVKNEAITFAKTPTTTSMISRNQNRLVNGLDKPVSCVLAFVDDTYTKVNTAMPIPARAKNSNKIELCIFLYFINVKG